MKTRAVSCPLTSVVVAVVAGIVLLSASYCLSASPNEDKPPKYPPLPWLPEPARFAEHAFKQGLQELKKKNWKAAIDRFREAQRFAPVWSSALFNLGWANDQAGGRELRALRWYKAYLAAAPGAEDAEAVEARIEQLKSATQNSIDKLMGMQEDIIRVVPTSKYHLFLPSKRQDAIRSFAEAWLDMGKPQEALSLADRLKWSTSLRQKIARELAVLGRYKEALEVVSNIWKHAKGSGVSEMIKNTHVMIAFEQAKRGDTDEARDTATKTNSGGPIVDIAIGKALIAANDPTGARQAAEAASSSYAKGLILAELAVTMASAGRFDDAIEALLAIPSDELKHRVTAYAGIGKEMLLRGDKRGYDYFFKADLTIVNFTRDRYPSPKRSAGPRLSEESIDYGYHSRRDYACDFHEAVTTCALARAHAESRRNSKTPRSYEYPMSLLERKRWYFKVDRTPWLRLARVAARNGDNEAAWQILQKAEKWFGDATIAVARMYRYPECQRDMTVLLAKRKKAPLNLAEAFDWAVFAANDKFAGDLKELEAESRNNPALYAALPSRAARM